LTKKKFFIIDGFAHIFRSFYAIKHLENNAVYGFCMFLNKLIQAEQPEYMVIALDSEGPTFRKEIYPNYKANRQAPPENLIRQIPLIKRAIRAFGIPIVERPGYEADDVMGTLAKKAMAEGFQAVLVTGDKDLLQLVSGSDIVYHDPNRDISFLTEDQVPDFFGCKARQINDLLTIWGDSSDNIPGVPGVGEKGAKTLLQTYGDLESIYLHLDEIKRKAYREGFEKARDQIPLLKKLVTIVDDLDIAFTRDMYKLSEGNHTELQAFFREMGFKSLAEQLGQDLKTLETSYPMVDTVEELEKWIGRIIEAGRVFFDLETSSLTPHDALIAGISFALGQGDACYIPLRHADQDSSWADEAEALLKPVFERDDLTKCAHNLKYDLSVLRARGWNVSGPFDDTMLMAYLLNPRAGRYKLDILAEQLLNYKTIPFNEVCGKDTPYDTFDELPAAEAVNYGAEDSDIGWQLWNLFVPQMNEKQLEEVYALVERDLIEVLVDMELEGVLLDAAHLNDLGWDMTREMNELQGEIFEEAGEEFNINSTKQLGVILFEKLKLPVFGKTAKTKSYSTNHEVLEKLAGMGFNLPALVLQYKSLYKLMSTYIKKLPPQIHPKTGRIHSSFKQIMTETGRLSSENPNLQNIPIRSSWGIKIREAFIARPGWILVAADYSQIELRLMAHFSEDPTLVKGFQEGEDIHRRTASEVFDIPLQDVTHEQRQMAKSINFGLIYGMGAFRLGKELGISRKQAQSYIETYFSKMPKVPEFTQRIFEETREKGEIRTFFGRFRDIPEINSKNKSLQARGERLAINTLIQGTAAEIIKLAMIKLHRRLHSEGMEAKLILQVHDELVCTCPEHEREKMETILVETMEGVVDFLVPLKVEVGCGKNWKEAKA